MTTEILKDIIGEFEENELARISYKFKKKELGRSNVR